MKTLFNSLVVGLAASFWLAALNCRADLEVSAGVAIHAKADFYEPLTPHGAWVEVGSYGRCWHPAHVAVEWRPYCVGHWVWTDCGWYWASDEPWGWACYHYGEWVYDSQYGWLWVPGIEWAPAWVEWRVGGGYIGWAPLAPRGVVVAAIAPFPFVFVETHRFRESLRPSTVIINNTTVLNKTTVINNLHQETKVLGAGPQKVFVNEGPGFAPIQKATGKTISAVPIREMAQRTPMPSGIGRRGEDAKALAPAPRVTGPEKRKDSDDDLAPDRGRDGGSFGGKGRGKGHGGK